MNRKRLTIAVIALMLVFFAFPQVVVEGLTPVVQSQNQLVVSGQQHGISYQVFRGSTDDHFVVRFYKEDKSTINTRVTDLNVNLEVENGRLLSVAPAGKIDDNKSSYRFSSRRGLNGQLDDKGLFIIFKYAAEENSNGKLSFSVTEYTQLSKTSVTKDSSLISFSLK